MTRIDIDCGSIELLQEKMLLLTYKDNYFIRFNDAIEIKDAFETLCPTGPIYCIVNLKRQFLNISPSAQRFLAKESPVLPRVKATAFIASSLPSRLSINYFINRYKPTYPSQVFSNVNLGLNWLNAIATN